MLHHSILTHWKAGLVDSIMGFLVELEPGVNFSIGYGGTEEEFQKIKFGNKTFLPDPKLRGPTDRQNYACWLIAIDATMEKAGDQSEAVYFTETDHLIFRSGYSQELVRCLQASGLDFLGKWCMDRDNTNEYFYLRYRDHQPLLEHLASISVRDSKTKIWGALANGMLFRRDVLRTLCKGEISLPCFTEIMIPSTLYHLGFNLGDFDTYSDIYRHVQYRPTFDCAEVRRMVEENAYCCHPFKDQAGLTSIFDFVRTRNPRK